MQCIICACPCPHMSMSSRYIAYRNGEIAIPRARVARCFQRCLQPINRPASRPAQRVGPLEVSYRARACRGPPAAPAFRSGPHVQQSRSHNHTNRADDSYRTDAHRAHERAYSRSYAPEKPCPIRWLFLSREHHGLAHLCIRRHTAVRSDGAASSCSRHMRRTGHPSQAPACLPPPRVAMTLPG